MWRPALRLVRWSGVVGGVRRFGLVLARAAGGRRARVSCHVSPLDIRDGFEKCLGAPQISGFAPGAAEIEIASDHGTFIARERSGRSR
jgi:hypothetical protein